MEKAGKSQGEGIQGQGQMVLQKKSGRAGGWGVMKQAQDRDQGAQSQDWKC